MNRVPLCVSLAALFAASACNAILGNQKRELDTGDDGGASDAHGDAPLDGSVDSPGDDGGPPGDGAASPCTSDAHAFCTDFEQGGLLWAEVREDLDSGIIEVSDARAVSLPNSLRALVTNIQAFYPAAYARKHSLNFPNNASPIKATVEYDLYIASQGAAVVDVFSVGYINDARGLTLRVSAGAGQVSCVFFDYPPIGADAGPVFTNCQASFATNRWVHMRFEYTLGSVAHFKATADGATFIDSPVNPPGVGADFTVWVGLDPVQSQSGQWETYVDNLFVDTQ
jgi:hypothetical protein